MIPRGTASLNDIVTDLDLTTANANLSDQYIRARAKKYSGSVSVDDLRGTVSAIMPTVNTGASSNFASRYENGLDVWNPWGNFQDGMVSMINDGVAENGLRVWCQHAWQGGEDCTVQSVHLGHFPLSNSGDIKVEGIVSPTAATLNTYMKWEIVGFQNNWWSGSPYYIYSLDNIRTDTDLAPYGPYVNSRRDFPYVVSIFYAVVRSAAPNNASSAGTVTGYKLWI